MVEVSLTVGKLDASLALLLTKDHHLIEFPTILLPDGVNAGSVITIKCEQDFDQEAEEKRKFEQVQDQILELFGTHEPKQPVLGIKNVTQTSAVLEWEPLELGSATIKSLTLYKNDSRLGQIPNPLVTKTTKLSGLPVDTPYEFYLRLDTTAGVYKSETVKLRTHKMTDLTGITVCLGEIDPREGITRADIESSLQKIGAKPLQDEVKVDTTHFITTTGLGQQWQKALDNNIPVVRPEWLKASETERRIVGVRNFYLDADPQYLAQHKFLKDVTPVDAISKTESESQPSVAAKAEEVKPEEVKPEEVKSEEIKTEEIKPEEDITALVEEPKLDEPKLDESKLEEPKADEQVVGEPAVVVPRAEESKVEEPIVETPVVEQPKVNESNSEEPTVEEPKVEEPKSEELIEEPKVEEPIAEEPKVEESIIEEPVVVEPVQETPIIEKSDDVLEESTDEASEKVDESSSAPTTAGFDDVDINANTNEDYDKVSKTIGENDDDDDGDEDDGAGDDDEKVEDEKTTEESPSSTTKSPSGSGSGKNKKKKKKGKK